jgi:hypothetical protein
MANKSPLQRVRDEHDSKERLAGKVLGFLDTPEDMPSEEFDDRIHKMSNKKLLRLWDLKELVEDQFGSREQLVDEIVDAEASADDTYRETLEGYNLPRLVGVAREQGLVED